MSEAPPDRTWAEPGPETGHRVVDEVLASLDRLETGPASEHVAVFESAHERLRGALAGTDGTESGSGVPRTPAAAPRASEH